MQSRGGHNLHWTHSAPAGHNLRWTQPALDTNCAGHKLWWTQTTLDAGELRWTQTALDTNCADTNCAGHKLRWTQTALDSSQTFLVCSLHLFGCFEAPPSFSSLAVDHRTKKWAESPGNLLGKTAGQVIFPRTRIIYRSGLIPVVIYGVLTPYYKCFPVSQIISYNSVVQAGLAYTKTVLLGT